MIIYIFLKKLKRKYKNNNRIYFYKNLHFLDYYLNYNKKVLKDVLKEKDDFLGHSTMLYLDFFKNKKLVYFDPDLENNYYYNFYPNKVRPLLRIAFNDSSWIVESIYMNTFNGFNGSIQEYYSKFNTNFNYTCTILSSIFGILSVTYPNKNSKEIFDMIMFKVKKNKNLDLIIKNDIIYTVSWKQLNIWMNNLAIWLDK